MHKNRTFFVRFAAFLCAVSLIVGLPLFADASILSIMSDIFGSSVVDTSTSSTQNSQKMDLLQAATNSDPIPKMESEDISVVNGTALTNENSSIGPQSDDSALSIKASSDRISLYTVRKGDTLQEIADMFNVTSNTILWANDLKRGSVVSSGQVLVILPVSGVKYKVKKGDTVESIAKIYKSDANNIQEYNNFDDSVTLVVGDELIIPDGVLSNEGGISKTDVAVLNKPSVSGKTTKTLSANILGIGATANTSKQSSSGYFVRPINGGVKTQGIHGHNGVDLASSMGTPIHAAAAGSVVISQSGGWGGGYGNYVVIQHANGMQTLYGHMSANEVSVGDKVSQGEEIGKMGSTGKSTGVHLHFEVRGGVNPF